MRGFSTVGLVLAVAYLALTGFAIYESLTCPELFCSLAAVLPVLFWTPLFSLVVSGPVSFFITYTLVVVVDLFILYWIGTFLEKFLKEHLASTRYEGPTYH